MNKKSLFSTIAYLGVSLCLCAGMIAYTGPGVSQEVQMARAMAEDIVEGPESIIEIQEEEVPLGATKITTKVSTKSSTKKTKMSKAAKKSSKSTKKNTKKSTKTSQSSVKKVVVQTTVLTTTVTSTKKASKVKTIKTTVKTTVKTTETQLSAASNTSTGGTAVAAVNTNTYAIHSFDDIQGKIDDRVYQAFKKLGFSYQCDPSISTTGVFSIKNHWIKLKVNNGYYLMHELGHFVSALKDYADTTSEWASIYSAEKANFSGTNKNYVTSTPSEYFAESFRDYSVNPGQLQKERPRTYNFMHRTVTSITQEDVEIFDDYYSLFW